MVESGRKWSKVVKHILASKTKELRGVVKSGQTWSKVVKRGQTVDERKIRGESGGAWGGEQTEAG